VATAAQPPTGANRKDRVMEIFGGIADFIADFINFFIDILDEVLGWVGIEI